MQGPIPMVRAPALEIYHWTIEPRLGSEFKKQHKTIDVFQEFRTDDIYTSTADSKTPTIAVVNGILSMKLETRADIQSIMIMATARREDSGIALIRVLV